LQERGKALPDPGEDERLGAGVRMQSVGLHVASMGGDSGEKERDPGDAVRARGAPEGGGERPLVEGAVVGRETHAEEEDAGPGFSGARDHRVEVGLEGRGGERAKAVVPAEFEDDKEGMPALQESGQTRASLGDVSPLTLALTTRTSGSRRARRRRRRSTQDVPRGRP
jgi:hypothetical protein